jgi:hypothetical protein
LACAKVTETVPRLSAKPSAQAVERTQVDARGSARERRAAGGVPDARATPVGPFPRRADVEARPRAREPDIEAHSAREPASVAHVSDGRIVLHPPGVWWR